MIRNRLLSVVSDEFAQGEELAERFDSESNNLPRGTLFTRKIKGETRYYHYQPADSEGKRATETYLRKTKEDEDLIELLARSKFVEISLDMLNDNMDILRPVLSGYVTYSAEEVMKRMPKAYEGIECSKPFDRIEKYKPHIWAKEPYERSELWPEALKHKSQNGILVRSKSEAIIASQLENFNIPYRYEQRLDTPDQSFYPDFTILNPEDNQIIYWEHFGLMEDEDYRKSAGSKLDTYFNVGILQWDNLITTYETNRRPLDAQKVRRIIKAILLPECLW
ncbi:hypothetical protein MASR2M70_10750 [Bacillota bacterium]